MSARDDGITGEVLDPAAPLPPAGPHCSYCGRGLVDEGAWVGEFGDLFCLPCHEIGDHGDYL